MPFEVTQYYLKSIYHYDPNTGWFLHKRIKRYISGEDKRGRLRINIRGTVYLLHRVIWLYVHGTWPEYELDHIDGDPRNNKLSNLRDVLHKENMQNMQKESLFSVTGLRGVSKNKKRFSASITKDYKGIHLGTYDTPEQAQEVYLKAKRELHPNGTI